jgi:hypothetical protein
MKLSTKYLGGNMEQLDSRNSPETVEAPVEHVATYRPLGKHALNGERTGWGIASYCDSDGCVMTSEGLDTSGASMAVRVGDTETPGVSLEVPSGGWQRFVDAVKTDQFQF